MADSTDEQHQTFRELHGEVSRQFGPKVAKQLTEDIHNWQGNNLSQDWRSVYDYAIHKAREKLSAPVITLDASEYEETMKFSDLMDEIA